MSDIKQNKSPNSLTSGKYLKFWNPPVFCLSTCLPAYLPVIRPTSGGRIRPVFSHNTEYQHTNTNLLFGLRVIHCVMVSPFILHCFSFWMKRWEITEEVSMNCMAYTYCVTPMAKWTSTWLHHLLKLLPSTFFAIHQFKSVRMVSNWDLYACSWAVIANTAAAKIIIKCIPW